MSLTGTDARKAREALEKAEQWAAEAGQTYNVEASKAQAKVSNAYVEIAKGWAMLAKGSDS